MGRERKCILCEMVCSSKQEMDDHMRTMLHHRELEKLMGRDCGHQCGVCGVAVASLTEYAGHISSPQHKHNVEAAERAAAGAGSDAADTEYFDQALVDLIEKRNQLIRKDEEAAVARRARDEAERRRQQAFQQRLREAKERFSLNLRGRPPPRGPEARGGFTHPGSRGGPGEDRQPWTHGRQGKSATWHAQEPAGPRGCAAGEGSGRKGYGGDTAAYPPGGGAPRGRHPWLSNRGSSNGLYGRNTIPQYPLIHPPMNPGPLSHGRALPPSLFSRPQTCHPDRGREGGWDRAGPGESHHGPPDDPGPKAHGSTAKPDKACRWSPYPPTKSLEKDTPPPGGARDRYPDAAVPRQHETAAGAGRVKKNRPGSNSRKKNRSSTGSGGGAAQQEAAPDGPGVSSPGPSKAPADTRQPDRSDRKSSLTAKEPGKTSRWDKKWPVPESKSSTSRGLPVGPLQSRQEQQISELLNKSKEAALERRGSAGEAPSGRRKEAAPPAPPSTEEAQQGGPESHAGANKENNCSQTGSQDPLPDLVRPSPCSEEVASCPDFSQYLQSVHVSTSSAPSAAGQEDRELGRSKERGGMGEDGSCMEVMEEEVRRSLQEQGSSLDVSDEATAGEMSQGSENEASRTNEAPQNLPAPAAPGLPRLGLPPVLTKHMGSKGKPGSHEPNLNIARRVRNVSESRRGEAEKESGLKPTVRQLISSSGSRRNVNWEQVYQEVRKKQGQGKGWPRFGIEMVSYDHEEQAQEEDHHMDLLEGFHWDSLLEPVTPRKRSLSESSVAPGRPASSHSLFSCQASIDPPDPVDPVDPLDPAESGPLQTRPPGLEEQDPGEEQVFSGAGAGPARGTQEEAAAAPSGAGGGRKGRGRGLQRAESVVEVCSSGAELLDAQAMGKKRRAAGDILSPEIHSLKKNKRMKIKSKKERFQVDQLLAVSLREEELSLSLQTLDTSLIQARAALQAAYMEVQHIMVLKHQVATEMGTLRNQRIELLKGMQGGAEDAVAQPQVKHEKGEADSPTSLPPAPATAGEVTLPLPPSRPASPPAPPPPPPTVKQEPLSPVRVSSPDLGSTGDRVTAPHSCTPETPASLTTALLDTVKVSPDRGLAADQINPPPPRALTSPAHRRGSPPAGSLQLDRAVQVDQETSLLDCKPPLDPSLSRRRASETGAHLSPTSSEMKSGVAVKRVRKLRKRRVLNKAQGAEPAPATSDTEAEEDASAAPRKLRPRRRSSAGSLVSTSRPPTAPEEQEEQEEEKVEESLEESVEEKAGSASATPAAGGEEEIDSALEMVNLESSEPEECMEVTMACKPPGQGSGLGLGPDPSRVELLNMACNEVTSTSNMDTSQGGRPDQSEAQTPLPHIKDIKTKTSDVSSDPGEEEPITEGSFVGHQEAVNGLQIHKGLLYTCSGDRTVKAFDLVSHKCVAVFQGHRSKVNCVLVSATVGLTHRLYSGSSDQTVRCYGLKTQLLEVQFFLPDRVLCLHSRWKVLYTGLANGTVATFNLKTNKPMEVFDCHGPRAVSCLSSSQEGARKVLLVGSFDSTISVRDARNGLLLRTLEGHTKTVLCMKVVNDLVFSGSSDQSVHAHNIHTGELVRVYKGHSHAVTVVAILGKVMLTASLDKLVRVYDLQSHDRLQVYGGHKDMVMCMTVHKSMIYTGCYDGSVQAVKLNLLQNYRCMWHGCSLVFGVPEHLQQHLADAHADPAFQTLRCRWRNCEEFFGARNGSKQGILTHMQNHTEELIKTDP